jgi:hypothetical protein
LKVLHSSLCGTQKVYGAATGKELKGGLQLVQQGAERGRAATGKELKASPPAPSSLEWRVRCCNWERIERPALDHFEPPAVPALRCNWERIESQRCEVLTVILHGERDLLQLGKN